MKRIACVMMVVVGCGKGADKTTATGSGSGTGAGSGSAAGNGAVTGSGAGAGSAAGSATAKAAGSAAKKAPPVTKAQRADYTKHLKAAYAAQKTKAWATAVTELEAALKALPGDQRALTELGWSAMNAGDYAKARKIDQEALAVTGDRNVKAMGLYNLGLVQEKLGDKDGALHSFLASLQLRPNATVEKEVGVLGTKPSPDEPTCAPGKTTCQCTSLLAYGDDGSDDTSPTCSDLADSPVPGLPGWHEISTHQYWQDFTYLLDEHGQPIAAIGGGGDHGRFSEDTSLVSGDVKTIGGHRVLWLETKEQSSSNSPSVTEDNHDVEIDSDLTRTAVTVCVIGDAKTPTRCPVSDVTHERTQAEDYLDLDTGNELPGKPIKTDSTSFDIALGSDGVVTIKLVHGSLDGGESAEVGPHKLW